MSPQEIVSPPPLSGGEGHPVPLPVQQITGRVEPAITADAHHHSAPNGLWETWCLFLWVWDMPA